MAQMRKLPCEGVRTISRCEPQAPLVSARQEILTSLVSALDSVCMAMSKLNAEVACVTVHEDSVIAVGTERGRIFLNSRREIQTDFYKFCRAPSLPNVTTPANANTKDQEVDLSKASKDAEHGKARVPPDAPSNVFVMRKMVEEVFTVLYSEAVGKSSLIPVPYEWIQKDPSCLVVNGLPEGISLKKPSEYDTKTLMKILEQSHRIHFTVKRPTDDLSRETKSTNAESNHNSSGDSMSTVKTTGQVVTPSSPATSANSVLSNFLYGMPMSSKPHPDGKLDFKPTSLLGLGKDRLAHWIDKNTCGKDTASNDDSTRLPGEQGQTPASVHISKRLLFSIVHEKSEKWDSFIRETEDINTLRECVQILFNSRYAEALGLDHMVPVPYRKIACDPGAVEIIGIPDQIPFKRPCTYGVPKLKRILDERHGIRFVVKRMFDERIFTAAGKMAREDGKHDLGLAQEDGLPENLSLPPATASTELVGNPHSSRSTSACVSPLADCEAGPSGDCIPPKRIKTEPPDGEIIQITVPTDTGTSMEEPSEPVSSPSAASCPPSASPSAAPQQPAENHAAETLSTNAKPPNIRRPTEAGNLVEDISEMILQLRRQVENLFSIKYAEALGLPEATKVPYSKFQMYPEDLFVTGLPEGISLRRPNCFGAAKLRKILAAGSHIQFVIKKPKLLSEQVKQEMPSVAVCDAKSLELDAVKDVTPLTDDTSALSKRPAFSDCLESKLSRIDLANTLREQVQELFNRKYGEALGIKYPVQVPYKRIKNNPDSVIIEGLPPGIPFRKPCTFGSQNLERILAVADKINFTITRPFQGLIPKPAPRRVTLLKKAYASISDDDDVNRLGEKVVLREQVKELFNKKYGEALGLDRSVVVPYKLIRGSPESVEVDGLPDDVPFRNPNTYDVVCLEKILQAAEKITFGVKTQLHPFAERCGQSCNTAAAAGDASTSRRKRKRVQESHRVPASSELAPSTNQIPVMQWPMYMVDYSGVNMQVPGKVNY
ncbi:general transcription factor II-I repeat domain-containing protein 1 isoform X1 [Entelurus aequoreus]|uniref:general transcription factor II-I repeat domain-containing protein 1 isoform X1 n=1 Tax=Entelurus aequoreus TaxID=161455 RepID=UPI002B1D9A50|nr:general transcription factor II-I repeat domain-containing protein 1 isoform X1 [Entelurus aequoreus]XP_061904913.1 general transcription factor II-I repeat domain-containing protein 1 isoform X1 [Entelurus aequoreus]